MPVGQFMAHANSFAAGKIHCAASGAQTAILLCTLFILLFVEAVYPIRAIIVDKIDDRAYTPGYRIRPIDKPDIARKGHNELDIEYSDRAPHGEHYRHWHESLARASANCSYRVRERKQEIKE